MEAFPHITADPSILGGKPIIAGTRISVALIMEWLGTGATPEHIADKHPQLSVEKVLEAIRYAGRFAQHEIIIEVKRPV
ncbi:MAG: DUF433 domain-containing protein [Bacteroidetes bacterium]|nr:MAG: DUF433 domain-containing protein [Bacteroidota bacterium]